jgi:hypothetical protein
MLAQKDNFERPGLDHYAVILPAREGIERLKNHLIETKTPIDEKTNESIKHYLSFI